MDERNAIVDSIAPSSECFRISHAGLFHCAAERAEKAESKLTTYNQNDIKVNWANIIRHIFILCVAFQWLTRRFHLIYHISRSKRGKKRKTNRWFGRVEISLEGRAVGHKKDLEKGSQVVVSNKMGRLGWHFKNLSFFQLLFQIIR